MANGLATVASFRDVLDAQAAISKLESEGIECSLANEYVVGMLWRLSTAVGGVQVQVGAEDLAKARSVLESDESHELASVPGLAEAASSTCPRCGSEDLATVRWSRHAAAFATFTGIPIPVFHTRTKCRACGAKFKPEAGGPSNAAS
jgi:hypothetical protein